MTKTKPKIVASNRIFNETRALLASRGSLDVNDNSDPWPHALLCERCQDASALLAFMTDRLDQEFFAACPNLKIVGAALKGYDNIDVEAAARHGVWVSIVPDLLTEPTAELAIGLMIALGRNMLAGDRGVRLEGFSGWRPALYGAGLSGVIVGLVGFGNVGQAIAARLAAFDCRLLAFDESRKCDDAPVEMKSLDELLQISDFIVLALPLTSRTMHIIDADALARMRPSARLINPARGSLVDEKAVAEALAAGRLAGYAADVFECEDWARRDRPARIDPFLTSLNAPTVLTPHLGSAVENVRREIELSAATSIVKALSGRAPDGAVNSPVNWRFDRGGASSS